MSSISLPCVDNLPFLLLVAPPAASPVRAAQLARQRFSVTQTDSMLDLFLMRDVLQFTIVVLNDEIGIPFMCAAAESVRQQWPAARILILGQVPAAMKDQFYDEVAVHSVDEDTLWSTIDKLTEDPWKEVDQPLYAYLRGASATTHAIRGSVAVQESDPTKREAAIPQGVYTRDLPSIQHRFQRRG